MYMYVRQTVARSTDNGETPRPQIRFHKAIYMMMKRKKTSNQDRRIYFMHIHVHISIQAD